MTLTELSLNDIIVVIDSREQNKNRINAVETWAQHHHAIVEHSKLDLCDYQIIGEFRGMDINIGIEAKSLVDFSRSYRDLPDKLTRSYNLYDDVGLFVEMGNYRFSPENDNFHATVINSTVKNGEANILALAVMENMLASLQREGIHVRQLRSEAHFPYSLAGLLISVTKPLHHGLHIKSTDYLSTDLNVYGKFPECDYKTAKKLTEGFKNLHWLASSSIEDLQQVVGTKKATDIYNYIRHELVNNDVSQSHEFQSRCDNIAGENLSLPPKKTIIVETPAITNHSGSISQSTPPFTPNDTTGAASHIIPTSVMRPDVQGQGLKQFIPPLSTPPIPATTSNSTENEKLFGKSHPEWGEPYIEGTVIKLSTHRMSARTQLEEYLETPHTLQECVDSHKDFTKGTIYEHIARMKREGVVTQFDNETLIMTKV